jgi:hypothetical protein
MQSFQMDGRLDASHFPRSVEMIAHAKRMLLLMDTEPTKATQNKIDALDAANKCIKCERQCEPGRDQPNGRSRGLCLCKGGCYWKFDGPRRRMNLDELTEYEAKAQRNGWVLKGTPGNRAEASDFSDLANEVKS